MSHPEQVEFCKSVQQKFPFFFKDRLVLDIGSLDINGSNGYLFDNCLYFGLDLFVGKNVDFVSKGHELDLPDSSIDTIISTECFEHDQFYDLTIKNILRMLKPGGLFVFTCATTGRAEHGTRRTSPDAAPFIQELGEWGDYYKNLDEDHIREILDVDATFKSYAFGVNEQSHDLYFWGIKKGDFVEGLHGDLLLKAVTLLKIAIQQNTEYHAVHMRNAKQREDALEARITTADNKVTELSNRVELMIHSNSWKITKPLRSIAAYVRGH